MASRNLDKARDAYKTGDMELSRAAHGGPQDVTVAVVPADGAGAGGGEGGNVPAVHDAKIETHKSSGQYIKSIVYGGLDGLITSFAVVAAVAGGDISSGTLLVLGIANLVADGLSMGLGDFLSSQAELEYATRERRREKWELENFPDGEKKEMVELYIEAGYSRDDAEAIMGLMMKRSKFFLDHMMVVELGIMPPDEDEDVFWGPAKAGMVTFLSFLAFGSLPLLSFIVLSAVDFDNTYDPSFVIAIAMTAAGLFGLGAYKSKFTFESWYKSGGWMLFNGTAAAGAAYFIGWAVSHLVDTDEGC